MTDKRAAIIAIGSEMLGPLRRDTNSLWLTERLEQAGIAVVRKSVVGDDPDQIGRELTFAASTAGWVFTTGGLGPTADDVTVPALAKWAGVPLRRDAAFVAEMRKRWERRGVPMPAVNEKQADVPEGARVLPNPRGTAPGFWLQKDGTQVIVLPGVPSEMREIFDERIAPELPGGAGEGTKRRVLRIAGMAESAVEEIIAPIYRKWSDDPVTILASPGEVELHLCARGNPVDAESRLAAMESDFREALGRRIHSSEGETLGAGVGRILKERGKTLAVAESCTGGLVSSLLTDVPGASAWYLGTVVSYADSAKVALLGVPGQVLDREGSVSEATALEMAKGARRAFGSDLAAAITGIAGPDGGSEEKPVGTVFFAVADRDG
ncbi:MAG: CinA family nicotinamide mononucleotide deamidase-related protein, partial [Acidobacteriota bacterium]